MFYFHEHTLTHTYAHTVQELIQLQDKHATRPDVFDDVEEEQEIEILTQEITQVRPCLSWATSNSGIPEGCQIVFFY